MQPKVYLMIGDILAQMNTDSENNENVDLSQDQIKVMEEKPIVIKRWNVIFFFQIIDNELEGFFDFDHCNILADNYLIAMVFIYFVRASLKPSEYTSFNFFVALYLANIMEEDDDVNYETIQLWAISKAKGSETTSFFKLRDNFFKRMNYRCVVSRSCCDLVMQAAQPDHKVWQRKRHVNHSGVISEYYRKNNTCPLCRDITEEKVDKVKRKSKTETKSTSVPAIKRFKSSH